MISSGRPYSRHRGPTTLWIGQEASLFFARVCRRASFPAPAVGWELRCLGDTQGWGRCFEGGRWRFLKPNKSYSNVKVSHGIYIVQSKFATLFHISSWLHFLMIIVLLIENYLLKYWKYVLTCQNISIIDDIFYDYFQNTCLSESVWICMLLYDLKSYIFFIK